jgi:hypothetical protein
MVFVKGDVTDTIPLEPRIEAVVRDGELLRPAQLVAQALAEPHRADVRSDPWGRLFLERVW